MLTPRSPALAAPLVLAALAALAGCGGAQPHSAGAPAASSQKAAAPPPAPAVPPGQVPRGELDRILAQGPPWLLRRVPIEEVIRGGHFIGWKLLALPGEWTGIDLHAGDVVTKVNGGALEKPDEFFEAWRSLATAKEIRVAYERDGAPREIVIPIVGEPSKDGARPLDPVTPPRPAGPRRRATTVIEEDDGTPPEDNQ